MLAKCTAVCPKSTMKKLSRSVTFVVIFWWTIQIPIQFIFQCCSSIGVSGVLGEAVPCSYSTR